MEEKSTTISAPPKWDRERWKRPDVQQEDQSGTCAWWSLRNDIDSPPNAKFLHENADEPDVLKHPNGTTYDITHVSDGSGLYDWVVHIWCRKLKETSGNSSAYPDNPNSDEWEWYIPTVWLKGTAWFVRDAESAEAEHAYLLTAGHNLVSRTPKDIEETGACFKWEPDSNGTVKKVPTARLLSTWNYDETGKLGNYKRLNMFESAERADAVYVVAFRAGGVDTGSIRYEGWADRACVSKSYLGNPIMKSSDIGALRIKLASFSKSTVKELWNNSPYVATFPPASQLSVQPHFAGVGIPGFLDKFKTKGGAYFTRHQKDCKVSGVNPTNVFDFAPPPAKICAKYTPTREEAEKTPIMQFSTTLIMASEAACVPPGMSGGPALLGIDGKLVETGTMGSYLTDDAKTSLAVGCAVAEIGDKATLSLTGGKIVSSFALFDADQTANAEWANPLSLLSALEAQSLGWHKYECGDLTFSVLRTTK